MTQRSLTNVAIPVEVLELFFLVVLKNPGLRQTYSPTTLMLVCKQWQGVGIRLLWTDICLRSSRQLKLFLSSSGPCNFKVIKSLTMLLAPIEPMLKDGETIACKQNLAEDLKTLVRDGNQRTRDLWSLLRQLASSFDNMPHLTSLSLHILGQEPEHAPDGFWIPYEIVHDIVKSLPQTVKYLELDTKCHDRKDMSSASHICTTIFAELPSLVHLRLRLAWLCSEIFSGSNELQSLVLPLQSGSTFTETQLCGTDGHDRRANAWMTTKSGAKARQSIVEGGIHGVSLTPSLQNFAIIDTTHSLSDSGSVPLLNCRDMVGKTTTSFPLLDVGTKSPEGIMRLLRYEDIDGVERDAVGNIADVEELVERRAWCTTVDGCRFPKAYRDSPEGRKHDWLKKGNYVTRDNYIAPPTNYMEDHLWEEEDKAGRKLLHVRTTEGVGEVEPMHKEKPDDGSDGWVSVSDEEND